MRSSYLRSGAAFSSDGGFRLKFVIALSIPRSIQQRTASQAAATILSNPGFSSFVNRPSTQFGSGYPPPSPRRVLGSAVEPEVIKKEKAAEEGAEGEAKGEAKGEKKEAAPKKEEKK